MRKLLYISLTFILLAAVSGCRHASDKRLVLADTLMWVNPDSSLAILNAINRDSLTSKEDLAYYALLLTQAQFRVEYAIPTDTLINNALDFYSDNHNREHYTRSLLYKGAFYEVHNNPVEAMKWFKQAEDNADTTDYRNLAQINMRLGNLYYNCYASNNLDLEKFKKALHYYSILGNRKMIMNSMLSCGNVARITNRKLAENYYEKALSIAKEMNDSNNLFDININCALMYIEDSLYVRAKKHILEAFKLHTIKRNNTNYYILGLIYANQKDLDSAKYFISLPEKSQNTAYDSMMMYKAMKEVALCESNLEKYREFNKMYNSISNSLEYNDTKYKLHDSEQKFDESNKSESTRILGKKKKIISLLIGSLLLLLIVSFLLYIKKKNDAKKLIDDLKSEGFVRYEDLRNSLLDSDSYFSNTMTEKLKSLEEIMAGAYNPQQDPKSNEVIHRIAPIKDTDSKFWDGLFSYLNFKHDGVMDKIKTDFPQLSTADLNFIGLMCCGFSDAAIAVCKQYRNTASVRSKRRQIKDKMGIEENLVDYLNSLTE